MPIFFAAAYGQVRANLPQGGDYLAAAAALEQALASIAQALARLDSMGIEASVDGDVVQPVPF